MSGFSVQIVRLSTDRPETCASPASARVLNGNTLNL